MPTSFDCQRSFPTYGIGISAPGGAQHGLEPVLRTTKNPATSAGHVRSTALGRVLPAQPPKRICSMLVLQKPGVGNQPHLGLSQQARSVRGLPDKSGLHQRPKSIALFRISSSADRNFSTPQVVDLTVPVEIEGFEGRKPIRNGMGIGLNSS
jgi:hypothetical protein